MSGKKRDPDKRILSHNKTPHPVGQGVELLFWKGRGRAYSALWTLPERKHRVQA